LAAAAAVAAQKHHHIICKGQNTEDIRLLRASDATHQVAVAAN
jgi:hypothetical protein